MTISVIIPVFNGGAFLAEAVASVSAQSCKPDELLLVDDGSTDGAAEAVASANPGIRYLRQENAGCASARNLGLAHATGDLMSFLDSDDLWPTDAVAANLACLRQNPAAQIVAGQLQVMRPRGDGRFEFTDYVGHLNHLGAALFRNDVLKEVGGFDIKMRIASDLDWFARSYQAGVRIHYHPFVTYLYRHHPGGLTGDVSDQRLGHVSAVRKALHRKRAAADAGPP